MNQSIFARLIRAIVRGMLSLNLLIVPALSSVDATETQPKIPFKWKSLHKEILDEQQKTLQAAGAVVSKVQLQKPDTKNPAGIVWFIIGGSATLTLLAESLIKVVKDLQYGGLIVDAQGDELKIVENSALDRHQILIRQSNGELVPFQFQHASQSDLLSLLKMAVDIGAKP